MDKTFYVNMEAILVLTLCIIAALVVLKLFIDCIIDFKEDIIMNSTLILTIIIGGLLIWVQFMK